MQQRHNASTSLGTVFARLVLVRSAVSLSCGLTELDQLSNGNCCFDRAQPYLFHQSMQFGDDCTGYKGVSIRCVFGRVRFFLRKLCAIYPFRLFHFLYDWSSNSSVLNMRVPLPFLLLIGVSETLAQVTLTTTVLVTTLTSQTCATGYRFTENNGVIPTSTITWPILLPTFSITYKNSTPVETVTPMPSTSTAVIVRTSVTLKTDPAVTGSYR
jgi:hypothetical protein